MNQFSLSDSINKENVFLINSNKIEKRLDVEYYQPKHYRLLEQLEKSSHDLTKLKKLSKRIVDGPFGSSVKADSYVDETTEGRIPFIRVADITHGQGTIETDDLIYISREKHEEIKRSVIYPGDVVIAKTGATMGAASIVPETIKEGNIRGDLAAISFPNNKRLSRYVVNFINTDIGYKLFWRLNSGSTRGRVVISNLKDYPIIVPDNDTMDAINNRITKGYQDKIQKQQLATEMLATIDAYLLREIGVIVPEVDNSLKNRVFQISFLQLNNRFDPNFHQEKYSILEENIKNSPNDKYRLDELFEITRGGSPRPINNYFTEAPDGLNWIKIGDTKGDDKYIYKTKQKIKPEGARFSRKVSPGDFLLSNSMSFGRPYIMKISGYIHDGWLLLSPKNKQFNNEYIHAILSSPLMYQLFKKTTIGGVVENLNIDLVKKITIPVPPIEKQNEIVSHLQVIRKQTMELKKASEKALFDAKEEVVNMILH